MKLIRISAIWCPACLIMRPRIDNILKEFPNIESVEYDYDIDDISNFNVGDILPVFILQDENKEVLRIIGEKSENYIKDLLKEYVKWN